MNKKFTLVLNRYGMGNALEELALTLITNYLNLLIANDIIPSFICCYAEGVKLCCNGSPVIDPLRQLEAKGVHILVCKTCLNYLKITEALSAGTAGTMQDIVDVQTKSDKVITL